MNVNKRFFLKICCFRESVIAPKTKSVGKNWPKQILFKTHYLFAQPSQELYESNCKNTF